MSEILLRAEDARGLASEVSKASVDAHDQFLALKGRLDALNESFRGKAAEAWDARFQDWMTSAGALTDSLDALGQFLNSAADQIEGVDDAIAGQLR